MYSLTLNPTVANRMGGWEQELKANQGKGRWSDDVEKMEEALKLEGIASHVSEIYSPPRVTALAKGLGLIPGMALDLTVDDPDDGKPWDFNVASKRQKALHQIFTK